MIDPTRWAVLARAVANDRVRQGLRQKDVVARVIAAGATVDERTVISLESGDPPKARKPIKLEPVVAALGWKAGWADRILAGEDPEVVLGRDDPAEVKGLADSTPRAQLLELLPAVHRFGQIAAGLGAPSDLRDGFDRLIQWAFDAAPGVRVSRADLDLAAARPHAAGEGVPADDAARIRDALDR